jgi:hypothetical protein
MKSQELSKICFPPRAYSGFKCLKTSQHINIQKGRIQITYNSQTKKRTETRVGEYCFRSHLRYPIVSSLLQVKIKTAYPVLLKTTFHSISCLNQAIRKTFPHDIVHFSAGTIELKFTSFAKFLIKNNKRSMLTIHTDPHNAA